jgi:hypothetical protein
MMEFLGKCMPLKLNGLMNYRRQRGEKKYYYGADAPAPFALLPG